MRSFGHQERTPPPPGTMSPRQQWFNNRHPSPLARPCMMNPAPSTQNHNMPTARPRLGLPPDLHGHFANYNSHISHIPTPYIYNGPHPRHPPPRCPIELMPRHLAPPLCPRPNYNNGPMPVYFHPNNMQQRFPEYPGPGPRMMPGNRYGNPNPNLLPLCLNQESPFNPVNHIRASYPHPSQSYQAPVHRQNENFFEYTSTNQARPFHVPRSPSYPPPLSPYREQRKTLLGEHEIAGTPPRRIEDSTIEDPLLSDEYDASNQFINFNDSDGEYHPEALHKRKGTVTPDRLEYIPTKIMKTANHNTTNSSRAATPDSEYFPSPSRISNSENHYTSTSSRAATPNSEYSPIQSKFINIDNHYTSTLTTFDEIDDFEDVEEYAPAGQFMITKDTSANVQQQNHIKDAIKALLKTNKSNVELDVSVPNEVVTTPPTRSPFINLDYLEQQIANVKKAQEKQPPMKLEIRGNMYYFGSFLQVSIYGYSQSNRRTWPVASASYGICFKEGNPLNFGAPLEVNLNQALISAELRAAKEAILLAKHKVGHNMLNVRTVSSRLVRHVGDWKERSNDGKNVLEAETWFEVKHLSDVRRLCNAMAGMIIKWTLMDPKDATKDVELRVAKELSMSIKITENNEWE